MSKGGVEFSSGTARYHVPPTGILFEEATASICDPGGQLLFFTDGSRVFNRRGKLMPGGVGLLGLTDTVLQSSSATQGVVIVPFPQRPEQYIIFSLTAYESGSHYGKLFYSIVDMSLDGGLGDMLQGQKGVLVDSMFTEKMTAVAGSNCNVWVVLRSRGNNTFKAFSVTSSGVNNTPVVSEAGSFNNSLYHYGEMHFSNDGKQLAVTNATIQGLAGLELLKFNKETGILSESVVLDNAVSYYSVCFSPDDTKLYASEYKMWGYSRINQFDLQASDPVASKRKIDSLDKPSSKVRLGPDRRIYYIDQDSLTGINNPNDAAERLQINRRQFFVNESTGFIQTLPNVIAEVKYDTFFIPARSVSAACWQEKVLLKADEEGFNYQWNDGSQRAALEVSEPGIYILSYYTAPCVYHSDTFLVSLSNARLPGVHINASCKGAATGKIVLQTNAVDTVHYNYTWYTASGSLLGGGSIIDSLSGGDYRLHIQMGQCDTQLFFTVKEARDKAFFDADTLACTATALSFSNRSDPYFSTWQWEFGDGQFSRQHSPQHSYTGQGLYNVQLVAHGAVCRDTFWRTIRVDTILAPLELHTNRDSLCQGESVDLHYNGDHTVIQYHLRQDNELLWAGQDTFLRYAFDRPGLHTLRLSVELRACPEQTLTQSIFVAPMPLVMLGSDTFLCPGANPVVLSNHIVAEEGDRFLWSTGAVTPEMMVGQPGSYALQITNRYGCSATESIQVHKDCYTDIPNVFTPNGDGINDYFIPGRGVTSGLRTFHMQIWNRWGQLLFETRSAEGSGWDGRFNNIEQPAGDYIYTIRAELDDGRVERLTGSVTLLR